MTTVHKTAASLRPGEVVTQFPFRDSRHHEYGEPIRWKVDAKPVARYDALIVDCTDQSDGATVRMVIGRHMDVTVETDEPQPDPEVEAARLLTGQMRALIQRLDSMTGPMLPQEIAALIAAHMDTARKETTR